jgi:hypothetical protein
MVKTVLDHYHPDRAVAFGWGCSGIGPYSRGTE